MSRFVRVASIGFGLLLIIIGVHGWWWSQFRLIHAINFWFFGTVLFTYGVFGKKWWR